jgi:hypothetical protein
MEAVDELVRIRIPASTEHAGIYAIHADVPWHCISCARREANRSMVAPTMALARSA